MSHGIHAAIEVRRVGLSSPTSWLALTHEIAVDDYRNRLLFTTLAGEPTVLGIETISPPRGLPEDVTPSVRASFEEWSTAAWDASWVTYPELQIAVERLVEAGGYTGVPEADRPTLLTSYIGVGIWAILAYLGVYAENGYDTRLVFWFTPI